MSGVDTVGNDYMQIRSVTERQKTFHVHKKEKRLQGFLAMISIVCVYNNERLLQEYLSRGLKHQTAQFELITVDNTKNAFKSAAGALNYGSRKAHGKYIMFIHQDIRLCLNTWISDAERTLDSLPNLGVAGIAGKRKDGCLLTGLTHSTPNIPASAKVNDPATVETVDECLIIVPRNVFDVLKFDESTCDSWHLYAVDYCLSSRLLGFETFVLPLPAYHLSPDGTPVPALLVELLMSKFRIGEQSYLPKEYYDTLKKVLKKHKKHASKIYTVAGDWTVTRPIALQRTIDLMRKGTDKIYRSLALRQKS